MQLHEQYRPASWSDLIGLDAITRKIDTLRKRGLSGRTYWITGASGTGKTTVARILAAEVADDYAITEFDTPRQVSSADLERIRDSYRYVAMGRECYIVNEAHGLRRDQIERLLGLTENAPDTVTWIFTTTNEGNELFEDQLDSHPFGSRCQPLSLPRRGLAEPFAARAKEIAEAEGLDGQPVAKYVSRLYRWSDHYRLRLTYERAMLDNEGGTVAEVEIEPGGWIHPDRRSQQFMGIGEWVQVLRVNKSPATKRVTSVLVLGTDRFLSDNTPKPRKLDVSRLGENAYRPPTDEERESFAADQKAKKAKAKTTNAGKPKLLNPTLEDARALQAMWNANAREPSEVWEMTQAKYSARSKGHGICETVTMSEQCKSLDRFCGGWDRGQKGREAVFKVRSGSRGQSFQSADCVVVITDKPQKPLPWDTIEAIRDRMPKVADLLPQLDRIQKGMRQDFLDDDLQQIIADAEYVGWICISSMTQREWTKAGAEIARQAEPVAH